MCSSRVHAKNEAIRTSEKQGKGGPCECDGEFNGHSNGNGRFNGNRKSKG
jgi:hypothetical protein